MPSNLVTNISLLVAAGGNVDVRPPVGQEWKITDFACLHAFVGAAPDVQVGLYNGVTNCISLADPTTDAGKRTRQYKFYLTNANYMRITNTGAINNNVGYVGEIVQPGLTRTGQVVIGATAYNTVRPPVGETWEITEWGADTWSAGEINPDVEIGLTNVAGLLVLSQFIQSTNVRGQDKQPSIIIGRDVYLNIYSTPGCNFAYTGRRIPPTCISSVQDVAGSGTLDIIPPIGDEWEITDVGAETWAGVAPNGYPDITVALRTTANANLMESGAGASLRWNSESRFVIDHDHFIRITETSTANNEVCVSGFLKRSY
jgi:hypothetical protein